MANRKQSKGECIYCARRMTRGGMAKHLRSCAQREVAIKAFNDKPGKDDRLFHLQVQDAWGGDYWLHLEMVGSASLAELDDYLRAIWLECCGHLSQFSVGGWGGEEIPFEKKASRVLEPGLELIHIYDFGTSSETLVKVVDERQGKPTTPHPLVLMARNEPPKFVCMQCKREAKWLCMECVYENEASGTLCDQHATTHPHDDYGEPLPIVNSPRMGMCGYDGPAEAPY